MPQEIESGSTERVHPRFLALPSTSLGRASAVFLLVAIVLMVSTSTVLEAVSLRVGSLNIVGAVNFLVLFAALVTGAVTLIRNHERSWAVWVSTALPAIVLGAEVISWLVPGD
jgi:hypothetical protein